MRRRHFLSLSALGLAGCVLEDQAGAKADQTAASSSAIPGPSSVSERTFGGKFLHYPDVKEAIAKPGLAMANRDRAKFLSYFTADLADSMGQWYDSVTTVPVTDISFQMTEFSGALFGEGSGTELEESSGMELDISFIHRIDGVDPEPVDEWYTIRASFTDSKDPVISSWAGAAPIFNETAKRNYSRNYIQAWDIGPVVYQQGTGAAVIATEGTRGLDLAAVTEIVVESASQARAVFERLGHPRPVPSSTYLYTIADGNRDLFDYFGGYVFPTEAHFRGFAASMNRLSHPEINADTHGLEISTTRIVLENELIRKGKNELASVVVHETTHALANEWGASGLGYPYLAEGIAQWVEHEVAGTHQQGLAWSRRTASGWDGRMTSEMYSGDNQTVRRNYAIALGCMYYVVDTYGPADAFAFVAHNSYDVRDTGKDLGIKDIHGFMHDVAAWLA
ncbi:MAG: hypothetical protein CSA84_03860 [Actinomycetales bacterium]|nr:MAG: hypothetical protein CSA84_03860 [Actinomycetales bacterium]